MPSWNTTAAYSGVSQTNQQTSEQQTPSPLTEPTTKALCQTPLWGDGQGGGWTRGELDKGGEGCAPSRQASECIRDWEVCAGMHQKGRGLRGGPRGGQTGGWRIAQAVGGGYCRLRMPLRLALAVSPANLLRTTCISVSIRAPLLGGRRVAVSVPVSVIGHKTYGGDSLMSASGSLLWPRPNLCIRHHQSHWLHTQCGSRGW